VFDTEEDIRNIVPDYTHLNKLDVVGVIVTAPGNEVDFVSRFFVPNSVIGEDPATGSAHCNLIPFWSKELNKNELAATQLSSRRAELICENKGERVLMAGNAVLYSKGEYFL
jgi:predicted PhzF superfamily epimerase YddE/YHI9